MAPGRRRVCTNQVAALFCVKWRHGRHLESVTTNQKSDSANRCVFTWRTFLPDFILIRFETTEPWARFENRIWHDLCIIYCLFVCIHLGLYMTVSARVSITCLAVYVVCMQWFEGVFTCQKTDSLGDVIDMLLSADVRTVRLRSWIIIIIQLIRCLYTFTRQSVSQSLADSSYDWYYAYYLLFINWYQIGDVISCQ